MSTSIILGSTSPYRRSLLDRLGLEFLSIGPDVDESAWQSRVRDPAELSLKLAEAKAGSVADQHPGKIVIGSDQVASLDGRVLGKPGTTEGARQQLASLAGREHLLHTSVVIRKGEDVWRHTDVSRLTMIPLTPAEIARYVSADHPVDCAGSYKIEARGIALFDAVATEDFTAITGLPLLFVARTLRQLGVPLP